MWYNGGMRNLIQHIVDGFRYSRNAFLVYFFADFIFIAGTIALLFTKHFILAYFAAAAYIGWLNILYDLYIVDSNIEPETEDDSEEC